MDRTCQLVNFTDRDWVVSQPFRGRAPNGILFWSFLCSHSAPPPGAEPGDSSWTDWCQAANRGRGQWQVTSVQWLSVLTLSFPRYQPSAVHNVAVFSILFNTYGGKLSPYASRRQRKRNNLVAWVGDDAWGPKPRLPSNSLYCIQFLNYSLPPAAPGATEPQPCAGGGRGGGARVMHRSLLLRNSRCRLVTAPPSAFHLSNRSVVIYSPQFSFQSICFCIFIPFLFFYWNF